jgi:serine protease Do
MGTSCGRATGWRTVWAPVALAGLVIAMAGPSGALSAAPGDIGVAQRPGPPVAPGTAPVAERCQVPVPEIYARVSPAVVFIAATSINPFQTDNRFEHVVGSGFVFDVSGLILTNSHVVFGRQSVAVKLDDGTVLPAELVGADPLFDVAIIRIPTPATGKLPMAEGGNSDQMRVGEEVLAIGNPQGLEQTLTRGIVSAVNRILPGTTFSLREPMIQTDAPINPGNSGGPLLNRCGEVIGITTAIMPDSQNIGFAIPINLVRGVLPSLLEHGRVIRPWIGFHGQLVEPPLQELLRIPLTEGFLVEGVEPGSPAEQAGLRGGQLEIVIAERSFLVGGDIVTHMNGAPVDTAERLTQSVSALKVGSTLSLRVFRNGKERVIEYTLPERPLLPSDLPGQQAAPLALPRGAVPPRSPGLPR